MLLCTYVVLGQLQNLARSQSCDTGDYCSVNQSVHNSGVHNSEILLQYDQSSKFRDNRQHYHIHSIFHCILLPCMYFKIDVILLKTGCMHSNNTSCHSTILPPLHRLSMHSKQNSKSHSHPHSWHWCSLIQKLLASSAVSLCMPHLLNIHVGKSYRCKQVQMKATSCKGCLNMQPAHCCWTPPKDTFSGWVALLTW